MVNSTNGIPNVNAATFITNAVPAGKSKIVTLLLCIFLGYLGVHRFYTGILYLLTGGIFYIGWIVDIIKIATGSYRDSMNRPLV